MKDKTYVFMTKVATDRFALTYSHKFWSPIGVMLLLRLNLNKCYDLKCRVTKSWISLDFHMAQKRHHAPAE